jgi:hypothetical protein
MKNIHILPTTQPSRLCIDNSCNELNYSEKEGLNSKHITNQHIYITSNKEIEEGDWFIDNNNSLKRSYKLSHVQFANPKKIILTTDPTLIADGVQAIDDEFLEWFVKNPTCEFVEVEERRHFEADKSKRVNPLNGVYYLHKIIIPQEETKQEILPEFKLSKDIFNKISDLPKQEILEEAAEKRIPTGTHIWELTETRRCDFIAGAKWQAERMYSEEEVKLAYNEGQVSIISANYIRTEEWFEQFKKK